ncbi:MAG: hypothetical protein K9M82_10690 [Deltaproteobacteria bacterium]|nr:hypothetical protein [Deltaproteobacteria bacterium]
MVATTRIVPSGLCTRHRDSITALLLHRSPLYGPAARHKGRFNTGPFPETIREEDAVIKPRGQALRCDAILRELAGVFRSSDELSRAERLLDRALGRLAAFPKRRAPEQVDRRKESCRCT